MYLWQQNTALLLESEYNLTRKSQLLAKKEKLTSTNKIHNLTDINHPPDLIELLKKGPNFIPTTDNVNAPNIKKTKEPAHTKPRTNLSERKLQTLTTNTILTATKKTPAKLLQQKQTKPHFNLHIIDYVHNTTPCSIQYLQSANFQNLFNPQHLNITQSLTSHIHNLNKNSR